MSVKITREALFIHLQRLSKHTVQKNRATLNQSPSRQVLSLTAILETLFGQLFGLNKTRALSK